MQTIISRFSTPFDKALSHYNDPKRETLNQTKDGGHWAYRTRSSISGAPERVYIKDRQAQREYCRQEGLTDPTDLPENMDIREDGKGFKNSQGNPGCWV